MATTAPDLARCCLACHATAAADGGPLKACGGCLKARDCSTACQKAGWKEHKMWCKVIRIQNDTSSIVPEPSSHVAAKAAFMDSAITALQSAALAALRVSTALPRNLTHCLVLSFGPKSTWKLGDPPASRFKLIAGSVQNDAEVLQNLRWVKEPKPDTMIRWMRYQEPGQLRPPTLGWELAPMLILFKTSEQANAEWDWRGTPLKFSLYGGNAYTPMESTDGWMEKLVTELANGGESEGAAQYDPITIQPLA